RRKTSVTSVPGAAVRPGPGACRTTLFRFLGLARFFLRFGLGAQSAPLTSASALLIFLPTAFGTRQNSTVALAPRMSGNPIMGAEPDDPSGGSVPALVMRTRSLGPDPTRLGKTDPAVAPSAILSPVEI